MIRGKFTSLFVLLLIYLSSASAQNETDVVRYFSATPIGTARMSSMAGSFGALGGDLSTALINPAGTGIYRKNEIGLTPGFSFNTVKSDAEGVNTDNGSNKLIFSNFGFASSSMSDDNKDLYFNYSMGYSKSMDINRLSEIGFFNEHSSMLFSFTDQADGILVNNLANDVPFTSHLAYENYLIDENPDEQATYTTQPLYETSFNGVYQMNKIDEKGSMGDLFVNLSAAVMEKVYIGATMSFINGSYEQNTTLTEVTTVDTLLLDEFTFRYTQNTDMSGLSFKLGLIIKPEKWLRVGLAWHLPYKLNLKDSYSTRLSSNWKDGDYINIESPEGYIEYSIKNPGKLIFSAAFITGFKGLINMDVEWMNYGASEIVSSQFDFSQENAVIAETLRNTLTIRFGGEIWFGRFNFRAGYAYRQNPYVESGLKGKDFYNTYSAGAGLLTNKNLFIHLSFNYKEDGNNYYPYASSISPLVYDKYNSSSLLLSVGKRF